MSQKHLLAQFSRYLDITSRENIAALHADIDRATSQHPVDRAYIARLNELIQEHLDYVHHLKEDLATGYCFGFALCHAAMAMTGKVRWWEHVLLTLDNWDECRDSLDNEYILPDTTDKKPTSLRMLFERAINYILLNHAAPDKIYDDFLPAGIEQPGMLDTRKTPGSHAKFFEILDENGLTHTVNHRKKIAGIFTREQLAHLLTPAVAANAICLIHFPGHSMHISCIGEDKWMLYNPNYSHEDIETMHFIGSKQDMINEIFALNPTHAFIIESAVFKQDRNIDFPYYEKIKHDGIAELLDNHGLFVIAHSTPEILPALLQSIAKSGNKKKSRAALANALNARSLTHDMTALHFIARFAPAELSPLFSLADQTPEGQSVKQALSVAILNETELHGKSLLESIISSNPTSIRDILRLADDSDTGKEIRAKLTEDTTAGKAIRSLLAPSLALQVSTDMTLIQMIARTSPASLPFVIALCLQDDNPAKNLFLILEALAVETSNKTGWQTLHAYASSYQKEILDILLAKLETLTAGHLLQIGVAIKNSLTDAASTLHGICKERHALFRGAYGKTTLWRELMEKIQDIIKSRKDLQNEPVSQDLLKQQTGRSV